MFSAYLDHWGLTPDGEPILTPTSRLLPVCADGVPAMLKIPVVNEEKIGAQLMKWWNGAGAPRVLAHDGDGVFLMERAPAEGLHLVELA